MGRVVQRHHISYKPEIVVTIYKGEHQILGLINRYEQKTVSKGFIRALKVWLALNEHRAREIA